MNEIPFNASEAIAALSLVFNVIAAIVALTWGLSRVRDAVRDEIDVNRDRFEADIDNVTRNFGEGLSALREKIREVELFSRDTFQRRDSAYKSAESLSADMKSQFMRLETRLDRMETKIDKASGLST